ncbi:unnamed protein product [Ectocarpus sp. 6 AP-2014]
MRGIGALCCALAAVHGVTGFVAPLSPRGFGQQQTARAFSAPSSSQQPAAARLRMVATDFPKFTVSLMDDTRVSFHMDEKDVRKLADVVNNILRSFKRLKANAAEGGKPYKEDSVEYKDTIDGLNIVVECNPNIFPDPFKAQVFVRVYDDKMEVSSQVMLTKLTDAIKQHLALFK